MPRPGPRPYDCVRRAWHSDRHQPIRGSLIQQIFRVVYEAHTATTKKNKEWQEKLPIVVLKAEEIMYSKANSEAEYTNLDTLWDRVNDAINTIIRREETTESGDLLPPCVEAALNLGCIPVRASRSQRHSNPRTYLTPRPQESPTLAPRVADHRTNDEKRPQLLPFHTGSQSNTRTPAGNSPVFRSESNINLARSSHVPAMDTNTKLNQGGSVYPLYYGTLFQAEERHSTPHIPEATQSKTIYVGTPVIPPTPVVEPTRQDYFARPDAVEIRGNPPREAECDLSLRLGQSERNLSCETDDVASSDMQRPRNKEFCFFPGKAASNNPFESSSRMWNSSLESAIRKGKKPLNREDDVGGQFCWQQGVPSNWFNS